MIADPDNKQTVFRIFLVTLLLLAVYTVIAYGTSYNHPGYDYYFHLKRFEALITSLREGTFPFYSDYTASLGYGYIHRFFYSDIILIPFAPIGMLTGAQAAYEVMLFVMTILCGLFMYKAVNTVYKDAYIAAIASLLYTFSVYRLTDIYPRSALGEVFAFTFLPIVFWGLYYIIKGDYRKWYVIAAGFSLLIFSHIISTVITFFTVVVLLIVYYKPLIKEPKRIVCLLLAGVVTIAITSSFIFPLFEQLSSNTFLYESNDWSLPARTKLSLPHLTWALFCGFVFPKNMVVTGIGIVLIIPLFARFLVKRKPIGIRSVDIGVFIGLFYILASSSLFPWGRFPFTLLSFIQYPTRLYLFVTFFFATGVAFYLSNVFHKRRQRQVLAVVIIVCTMLTMYIHSENFRYTHEYYIGETNEKPLPGNFFYLNGGEYVPALVGSARYIQSRGDSIISSGGNALGNILKREKGVIDLSVQTQVRDSLELPLFYYLGYAAELNGEKLPVFQSRNGLVQIAVNESGKIKIYYAGTPVQKISWYVTIISLLALCIYIFISRKKIKKQ